MTVLLELLLYVRVIEGWDQGSQAMGSGSAVFRDEGSGCTSFVGSGTKICDAFDIKDQKFGYKNGISNVQKHTWLRPWHVHVSKP